MRKFITLGTLVAMVALMLFSGVAEAEVMVNGSQVSAGDYTTGPAQYNLTNTGENHIDEGSHWTQNDDGFKMANRAVTSMTISGGGWLEVTVASVSDSNYALQVGNQDGGVGDLTVTGTDSKATTLALVQVGRIESGCTLTIEDGGLVMAEGVTLSRDGVGSGSGNLLRMKTGGMLAIEGTGKTTTGAFWTGTGELQYWNGSAWANITGATAGTDYTIADGSGDLATYSVLTMAGGTTSTPGTLIYVQ